MITDNLITIGPPLGEVSAAGDITYFVQAPYKCQIADVLATAQNATIGAITVVVSNGIGGTTIGTATFAAGTAAQKATYVAAAAGEEIDKDGIIQIVVGEVLDAVGCVVTLVLDPYCLS